MAMQINVRFPDRMLASVRAYAEKHGYGSVQDFIKETIREKLYDEPKMTPYELAAVRKLAQVSEEKGLYGTEKELFRKLKGKK